MPISKTPKRVSAWHAGERQRHAPMVVERLVGGVSGRRAREACAQHLLRAGLAGAARDGDDAGLRGKTGAGGAADVLRAPKRIVRRGPEGRHSDGAFIALGHQRGRGPVLRTPWSRRRGRRAGP